MLKRYLLLIFVIASIVFIVTILNKDINSLDGNLNKSNINYILNYLDAKYEYTYDVNEINFDSTFIDPKTFEYNASVLFRLINDLNVVRYRVDGKVYKYYFDDLNTLFNYSLREKELFEIKMIYSNLRSDMYYLGNIKGIYRMYTKSEECSENNFLINEDNYKFNIECYKENDIVILDSKYNRFGLKDMLDRNVFTTSDLTFYNLHLQKEIIDESISE
jgi:hypothetical protein